MKIALRAALLLAALCAAGCTINTRALKRDMTTKDVVLALGYPQEMCADVVGGKRVEVWDYSKETLGIPNPLDDYWWVIPPSTKIARLWFVNGYLKDWQEGKFTGLDQLHKLEDRPEWKAPPDFANANMPRCIRDLSVPPKF